MIVYCIIYPNDIRRALRGLSKTACQKVTHMTNFIQEKQTQMIYISCVHCQSSRSLTTHLQALTLVVNLLWQRERTTLYEVKFEPTLKTHLNLAFFRAKSIKWLFHLNHYDYGVCHLYPNQWEWPWSTITSWSCMMAQIPPHCLLDLTVTLLYVTQKESLL